VDIARKGAVPFYAGTAQVDKQKTDVCRAALAHAHLSFSILEDVSGRLFSLTCAVKRAHRLRRPRQFQRVRREGRSVHHRLLRLTVAPNRRKQTRCGFVVSKRIGKAVVRNRAKRRVREATRLDFAHIAPGSDLVFVIRTPEVAEVPFASLRGAIRHMLQQGGVWRDIPAPEQAASAYGEQTLPATNPARRSSSQS
jgi:ribonuclease P protein component